MKAIGSSICKRLRKAIYSRIGYCNDSRIYNRLGYRINYRINNRIGTLP